MKALILILMVTLSLATIIAENPLSVSFIGGKNNFTSQDYFPSIYVSEFVKQNPNIQSISISEYGTTFGYINAFGGVGTNFLIEPGKDYEIYTNQSIVVYLID